MTTTAMIALSMAAVLAASVPAGAQTAAAPNDVEAADLIATQLRQQGYDCNDPYSGIRDKEASSGEETVWVVGCKNATYRVRLIPDMAAQVEQVEQAQ